MEIIQQDIDNLLSYNSKQQVQFRDPLLGIVNYGIIASIMVYIVGYVFVSDRGYLEVEAAKGVISTLLRGEALGRKITGGSDGNSLSQYFSAEDLSYPGLENGHVFITTKLQVQEQERGVCEDPSMRCLSAEDCSRDIGAECTSNRLCLEPSWCPLGREESFKLATDTMQIWAKSAIIFQSLRPDRLYANNMAKPILYPEPDFNTFELRDLLQLCDPPVRFEEISELGAAIEVQFIWDCQVDSAVGCDPYVRARRIDVLLDEDHIGFSFTHPEYEDGAEDKRTLFKRTGIRLYFRTLGVGSAVAPSVIIFKLSTGMALVGFAPIVADIIMLNCFKQSPKYRSRKYVITEDLGDYFEELTQKNLEKELKTQNWNMFADDDEDIDQYDEEDQEWKRRMKEDDDDF